MSRSGGNYRSSADDLAYGESSSPPPQRWDRDRFERVGRRPPPPPGPPGGRGYEEEYRYTERDRPGRREIFVADRVEERGPPGRYEERDRYVEEERYTPTRPRRRTDRELFGDVDPRELANMALTPYRKPEPDYAPRGSPRPGMLRRQSSLDTFDRRRAPNYERDDYRPGPYQPGPPPSRRPEREREREREPWGREDDWEEVRNTRYDEPEDYREVEIRRERTVRRRRPSIPKSVAKSVKSSKAKSVRSSVHETVREQEIESSSSSSSESFEEVTKESNHESIHSEAEWKFKKGKTRMPKRLVKREAIMDLGYPFDEEEDFFVLRMALEKEQIDEVIRISETYKDGEKNKKIYRFEETIEEKPTLALLAPPVEREEVLRTEWVNPPSVIMTGARSIRARSTVRAPSPSGKSTATRHISPARTQRTSHSRAHSRAHSRRPSSPGGGTVIEERRTIIEERRSPPPPPAPPSVLWPPPPPGAIPVPASEYISDRRTVYEEVVVPSPSRHSGALVVQEREYRSDRDIQAEIRALTAERKALKLEREAEEKRERAGRIRERPEEEFQLVEYRERRPGSEGPERERSPPRNVTRVEKDRKERRKARLVAAAMATLT